MWKRTELDKNKEYFLSLCQKSNGDRYFSLHEVGENVETEAQFTTETVPFELLFKLDLEDISESVSLINGKTFGVDAHGIWLYQNEMEALMNDVAEDQVPWVNGLPPNFALR